MKKPPVKIVRRKLGRERADGLCTWDGKVHVDERLKGIAHLETVLHELLHNEFPSLREKAVAVASRNIAAAMFDDDWRRVEQ
jgi:hypothetical protein